jgi:hypothetical protein
VWVTKCLHRDMHFRKVIQAVVAILQTYLQLLFQGCCKEPVLYSSITIPCSMQMQME